MAYFLYENLSELRLFFFLVGYCFHSYDLPLSSRTYYSDELEQRLKQMLLLTQKTSCHAKRPQVMHDMFSLLHYNLMLINCCNYILLFLIWFYLQYEGAVKADGRGPSVWDSFSHTFGNPSFPAESTVWTVTGSNANFQAFELILWHNYCINIIKEITITCLNCRVVLDITCRGCIK